ncbi:hypothetical protein ACFWP3_28920 [Streptomyces sp. NPDC058525]|uniref:hypothetical protein n=1 Tax=Streptomyces sp. NPDC058525 TaxID=3346538 RepID=UPI003664A625
MAQAATEGTAAGDPHGDRAWATTQFYPLTSGNALNGFLVEGDPAGDITIGWTVPAGALMSWTEGGAGADVRQQNADD